MAGYRVSLQHQKWSNKIKHNKQKRVQLMCRHHSWFGWLVHQVQVVRHTFPRVQWGLDGAVWPFRCTVAFGFGNPGGSRTPEWFQRHLSGAKEKDIGQSNTGEYAVVCSYRLYRVALLLLVCVCAQTDNTSVSLQLEKHNEKHWRLT